MISEKRFYTEIKSTIVTRVERLCHIHVFFLNKLINTHKEPISLYVHIYDSPRTQQKTIPTTILALHMRTFELMFIQETRIKL